MKLVFFFLLAFTACKIEPVDPAKEASKQKFIDSFMEAEHKKTDSIITKKIFDTIGLSQAPVKILLAHFVGRDNIELKWKNISNKKIAAIRFKWYGLNAFDEPADMGNSSLRGFGGGFSDQELAPGKTNFSEWSIFSRDGKKIILAWPYEVAFSDGSKWKLNN